MRALDSAIGFPRRPTSASSMLGLLMPEEVRRSFMRPPGVAAAGENALGAYVSVRGRNWQTERQDRAENRRSLSAQVTFLNAGPCESLSGSRGHEGAHLELRSVAHR